MNWCEHWIDDKNCYGQQVWRFKGTEGLKTWDDYTPNYCPACGAKRPEQPKKLGEIYNDAYYFCSTPLPSEGTKYGLQAVVDAICERIRAIPNLIAIPLSSYSQVKQPSQLKEDIIQEIRGML